ncbi:MAG: FAD-dependent oxidoreductase [Lachnospiraceae bacterium]|nr:FAD-dependent oxidoreductase [Lachnospiraceae bacterium]
MIIIEEWKRAYPSDDPNKKEIADLLGIAASDVISFEIIKRSIDARKKPDLFFVYNIAACIGRESDFLKRIKKNKKLFGKVKPYTPVSYVLPESGNELLKNRPVIVGFGPAGMFCSYLLAKQGYRPIVLERGRKVEDRTEDIKKYWKTGILDTESNVSFGEGGAGTFSDGKLATTVKDPSGRCKEVMKIFTLFGADPEIIYDAAPHIGTDKLCGIVKNMREEIKTLGGSVLFESRFDSVIEENGHLTGIRYLDKEGNEKTIPCEILVLAPGHSARDTFYRIRGQGFVLEPKSFAVGFRAEHRQEDINLGRYGKTGIKGEEIPGAASYKLTAQTANGRSVFSFCMCPGGYVVDASSEEGMIAVNGMSYSGRDSENANSAIIVSVTPDDFPGKGSDPLSGIEFQRDLERKAYYAGKGKVPIQRLTDFYRSVIGEEYPVSPSEERAEIRPVHKGRFEWSDLSGILPDECNRSMIEAFSVFGRKIKGFDDGDVILSGVESRTSSPVRIVRGADLESNIKGVYPCGEGAGYAGGITSAAMDGLRVAEAVIGRYAPFDKTDENA